MQRCLLFGRLREHVCVSNVDPCDSKAARMSICDRLHELGCCQLRPFAREGCGRASAQRWLLAFGVHQLLCWHEPRAVLCHEELEQHLTRFADVPAHVDRGLRANAEEVATEVVGRQTALTQTGQHAANVAIEQASRWTLHQARALSERQRYVDDACARADGDASRGTPQPCWLGRAERLFLVLIAAEAQALAAQRRSVQGDGAGGTQPFRQRGTARERIRHGDSWLKSELSREHAQPTSS